MWETGYEIPRTRSHVNFFPGLRSGKFWRQNITTNMETIMAEISTAVKRELQDDKANASQPLSSAADREIDSNGAIDPTDLNSQAKLKKKRKPTRAARRLKAMQKHIRRAKEKENAQLAEKRAEVEKQIAAVISLVQADIQNLVEAEKRKSVQYLSLARKYYSMWKTLNDERSRQKRTSKMKETSPQENDSTFDVSLFWLIFVEIFL